MEFYQVSLEAHRYSATIYVMGLLADAAALRTGTLIDSVPSTTRTVRLDLRGVGFIDPSAFVSVARSLSRWRETRRGCVTIEFPAQSPATTDIFDEHAARSAAC